MKFPVYFTEDCFRPESKEVLEKKIDGLLNTMTADEKAAFCHGQPNPEVPGMIGNGGYLAGVPRLGVPEIRMYDGPAGVTSMYETTGLPAEEMLASSWSRELAYQFGQVTGSENRMISGNCQLGAELDLVRTTHFNRTRDMLGEDPFLAGELAVPLVKGIQDQKVMAVLKHFAGYVVSANPADAPDTVIDEQTMHELYLPAFEKAIHEADAAGVMTAYSRINGTYASASEALQKDILRKEWKFDGLIMCDWGGNHSFTLKKGTDIEMPFGVYNSTERILRFMDEGKLDPADLDEAVRHILSAMGKAGFLSLVEIDADGHALSEEGRTEPIRLPDFYATSAGLRKENAKTAQLIAEKGAELLKNDSGILPLRKDELEKQEVAVIGMGGFYPVCGYGQERSYGTLEYMNPLYKELEKIGKTPVKKAIGIDCVGTLIPEEMLFADENGCEKGLSRFYGITEEDGYRPAPMSFGGAGVEFTGIASHDEDDAEEDCLDFMPEELFRPGNDAADMEGHITGTLAARDKTLEFICCSRNWKNSAAGTAFTKGDAYTWKGYLHAPEDGEYQINLQAIGGIAVCKMMTQDGVWKDMGNIRLREGTQWPWGNLVCTSEGMEVCAVRVNLKGGKRYPIVVYAKAVLEKKDLQIRLAWVTPSAREKNIKDALDVAAKARKVIFTVHKGFNIFRDCFNSALGFGDDLDLELENDQKELLERVSEKVRENGGKLVTTAFNGSCFAMKSWIDRTDALMWMWMPGQSGCTALARLLTGEVVPSGKISQSFPGENEDTPVSDTKEHEAERILGVAVPGKPRRVIASEGIFTGYRWYDQTGVKPLFPFGFGLSYTTFEYSGLKVTKSTEEETAFDVEIDITNTGKITADEIVQIYLDGGTASDGVMMAKKRLCAFERLEGICPGETRHARLTVSKRSLMVWNTKKHGWEKVRGPFKVMAGSSSADIREEALLKD